MRIAFALVATGAFFVSGCQTSEMASRSDHEIFVTSGSDLGETGRHVNIAIKRGDEDPIHIEGDVTSPDVQEQLALLSADGIHLMGSDHHLDHSGPVEEIHKWEVRSGDDLELSDAFDIDEIAPDDENHIALKSGGNSHTIVVPDESDGKQVFIMKDSDHTKPGGVHKKVIVIKGDNEEEVRKQLKEHGFDLEFDFKSSDEEDKVVE